MTKRNNPHSLLPLLLLLAILISADVCQAQSSGLRYDIQEAYNTNTQLKIHKSPPQIPGKVTREPQYALFRNVVRRNMWLEGQGDPITQEVANQLPCYFRLSMKNSRGHYQFVEALHGSELTDAHSVSPYILDKKPLLSPDSVVGSWDERFASIGQWLITSDLSGDKVVEERAYEARAKNANLVYAFQPIYNDASHVTGSYTDSWGLPIDINPSDDHYFGSVVYVTLASNGLDSIVDHVDSKGLCRYNEYGVDQTRYLYDDRSRLISVTSHSTVGDRVNDRRGICGTLYDYDDDMGACTVTHVDKYLQPALLSSNNREDSFVEARVSFDQLGRKSSMAIFDDAEATSPITTLSYRYSADGRLAEVSESATDHQPLE